MSLFLSRGPLLAAISTVALSALTAGCGDGPICQSATLVVIASPSGAIVADSDPRTDGIQQDVEVRTTFPEGATITLTVVDPTARDVQTLTERTLEDGSVTFTDVTIPAAGASLRVTGDAGVCGHDEDTVTVTIVGGGDCGLDFATAPLANEHFALPVWNTTTDDNPNSAGHQSDAIITARPGEQVKLFVSSPGTIETEVAAGTVADDGTVRLATSLPDGQNSLRAECGVADVIGARSSGVRSVLVDTEVPTCTITGPVPGTSITPSLDSDGDLDNGVQLTLTASAAGADAEGEAATFTLVAPGGATTALVGSDVDGAGASRAAATFDPDATPADYTIRFASQDHAGNPCSIDEPYRVVFDGCAISVIEPSTTQVFDYDDDPANGAQVEILLYVEGCAGQRVTSDCGLTDVSGNIQVGGLVDMTATVCTDVPCESSEVCTVRVTSADGIEPTAGVPLDFDNLAPNVAVAVAAPSGVTCGATIAPGQDADPAAPGVQLRMRVTAPTAVTRELRLTNSEGTVTTPVVGAGGEEVVTIAPGANTFVGRANDASGNVGTSAPCAIGLSDIALNFTGTVTDGVVGAADGPVTGSSLTFTVTGTVSASGATVTVSADGGPPVAATVTGTSWSATLTLDGSATPYTITAAAIQGPRLGAASIAVTVDLTPPSAPGALTAFADTRQSIRIGFTAPAGAASYRVKFSTVALTDANFDSTGTVVTAPTPGPAGSAQVVHARPLRAGVAYWVAVASVDSAGNRSVAQLAGPLTPAFDHGPVATAPNTTGNAGFGLAMVHGRFNDDAFEDVAVGAPFVTANGHAGAGEVYVYLGSAAGLATTPSLTIQGTQTDASLGSSLAALHWSSTGRHDLAIGGPGVDGFSGAVYVFDGGAALPTGTVPATAAPRRITVATAVNWFTGSAFGWQLATADHDGDGRDDLVATAVFGAGGASGAAVVLYGGTVPTGSVRISDTSAAGSGTAVMRMYEDPDATGALFGYYLTGVGPTTASDTTDDLVVGYAEDMQPGATVFVYRGQGRPAAPGVSRESFAVGRDVRLRYVTVDTQLEWGAAVGSIADQNGDGARELVLGDYRDGGDAGSVYIVDGDTVGVGGTALLADVTLTALHNQVNFEQFGMAVANNAQTDAPDVNGDGIEDLVIAGRAPGTNQAVLDVFFGPIAPGIRSPSPDHVITGPVSFAGARPTNGGTPITAIWSGDVNADGLDDICWADWTSHGLDGALEALWDDGL